MNYNHYSFRRGLLRGTMLVLLALSFNSSFGQQDSSKMARVYFLRSTGFSGAAMGYKVFIDSVFVCKLNNNRFSRHLVTPGTHSFSANYYSGKSKEKKALTLDLEAGGTYYIQLTVKQTFLTEEMTALEITKSSANKLFAKLKEDPDCGSRANPNLQ